jgi:drug/metabolite transporter (DMT)-like permease
VPNNVSNAQGDEASARLIAAMPMVFVLIWSTGFIVARFGMPYAPPMTFLVWRFFFSILCFGLWIALTRPAWPTSRMQFVHLGVTGMLMHTGYLGGVWAAVKLGMGAALVALIMAFQPIITAIWVSARGGHVSRIQWLGLVLGFSGLSMVVHARMSSPGEVTLLTAGMALLALTSITIGTLYQKAFVKPCDVRTANTVQLMAAFVAGLPIALFETESMVWATQASWAMAWSVLGLTLGGSSLMYLLIQRGAVTAVASLLYLVPPCTAVMAWLLFGETMNIQIMSGVLLTAVGVYCVVRLGQR